MRKRLTPARSWIASILAALLLAVSLCPSECLAGEPEPQAHADCHESAPEGAPGSENRHGFCCVLAVAPAASSSEASACLESTLALGTTPSTRLAVDLVHVLRIRPHRGSVPDPFHDRSPILVA